LQAEEEMERCNDNEHYGNHLQNHLERAHVLDAFKGSRDGARCDFPARIAARITW
jgi:hypothetical protein